MAFDLDVLDDVSKQLDAAQKMDGSKANQREQVRKKALSQLEGFKKDITETYKEHLTFKPVIVAGLLGSSPVLSMRPSRIRTIRLQWAPTSASWVTMTMVMFIDMECGVRYGIIGDPVPIKKAKDGK